MKATLYARVSTNNGQDPTMQTRELREYCERRGQQYLDMLPADPLAASFDACASRSADAIGHVQGRPVHLLVRW